MGKESRQLPLDLSAVKLLVLEVQGLVRDGSLLFHGGAGENVMWAAGITMANIGKAERIHELTPRQVKAISKVAARTYVAEQPASATDQKRDQRWAYRDTISHVVKTFQYRAEDLFWDEGVLADELAINIGYHVKRSRASFERQQLQMACKRTEARKLRRKEALMSGLGLIAGAIGFLARFGAPAGRPKEERTVSSGISRHAFLKIGAASLLALIIPPISSSKSASEENAVPAMSYGEREKDANVSPIDPRKAPPSQSAVARQAGERIQEDEVLEKQNRHHLSGVTPETAAKHFATLVPQSAEYSRMKQEKGVVYADDERDWNKLVGGAKSQGVLRWRRIILKAANIYGVHPRLIAALISRESSGISDAISTANAIGLTQVIPRLQGEDVLLLDPEYNVKRGTQILRSCFDNPKLGNGSVIETLKRYNAGSLKQSEIFRKEGYGFASEVLRRAGVPVWAIEEEYSKHPDWGQPYFDATS